MVKKFSDSLVAERMDLNLKNIIPQQQTESPSRRRSTSFTTGPAWIARSQSSPLSPVPRSEVVTAMGTAIKDILLNIFCPLMICFSAGTFRKSPGLSLAETGSKSEEGCPVNTKYRDTP
jgi:hypothetical protein